MKRILSIVFLLCLNFVAKAQYPIQQNLGSANTLINVPATGGMRAAFVNRTYTDTAAANSGFIAAYPFAQIATTSDGNLWMRNASATGWVLLGGGESPSGNFWRVGGNLLPVSPLPYARIGTLTPYGGSISLMTNSIDRLIINDTGLFKNQSATDSVLVRNTSGEIGIYPRSAFTPTWQQTLTAGSTLTGNNTIAGDVNDFTWDNMGDVTYNMASTKDFIVSISSGGNLSEFRAQNGAITGYTDNVALGTTAVFESGTDLVQNYVTKSGDYSTLITRYDGTNLEAGALIHPASSINYGMVVENLSKSIKIGKAIAINSNNFRGLRVDSLWQVYLDSINAGSATDSILVINQATGQVGYRNASSIGSSYTFTNGLTESGGTVKLGGTLVDAITTVDANNNELYVTNATVLGLYAIAGSESSNVVLIPDISARMYSTNGTRKGEFSATPSSGIVDIEQTNGSDSSSRIRLTDQGIFVNPDRGNLKIDSLNYTLSTTGKKIMLRDTASGLVQNIDPALIGGTPGGSDKQIQYNNAGAFGGSANMTQETGQILISSTSSTNPFVVKGHEDNGQGSISEWQEHSAAAVLFSVNQDTTLSLRDFSGTVTTPAANFGKVYSRDDSLRFKNSAGTEFTLGAGGSSGLTVGTTAIASGTATRLLFEGSGNVLQEDDNLTFNATDNELLIATTSDDGAYKLQVGGNTMLKGGSLKLFATGTGRIDYDANGIYAFANSNFYVGAGSAYGLSVNSSGNVYIGTSSSPTMRLQVYQGRFGMTQGTDVASVAGAIALSGNGNTFEITGTDAITLISNANWQNGSIIYLVFTSTATLTDGTANSGTDIGMELAGGANFTASADDVVTLVLSEMGGTQRWREVARSVN